jgi:hypothetical protein
MRRTTVMSWDDSNFSGNEWTWEIFVTARKDGTFSAGARQKTNALPGFRVRGSYRLKTGAQLKTAIEELFTDDVLEGQPTPDWTEIVRNLRKLDGRIANQVQAALDQEASDIGMSANPEESVNRALDFLCHRYRGLIKLEPVDSLPSPDVYGFNPNDWHLFAILERFPSQFLFGGTEYVAVSRSSGEVRYLGRIGLYSQSIHTQLPDS